MEQSTNDRSIIIIGGGFAGLSAGIYCRMNGYKTRIFEMHSKPGGLCTSWNRDGFTIDGCIHWLVGSSPMSSMYSMWEETGIARNREFIDYDEYVRFEGKDGRVLIFYTDIQRLEKHLLTFSPEDKALIKEFIKGIRLCLPFDTPSKRIPFLKRTAARIKMIFNFVINGRKIRYWINTTAQDFAEKFHNPLLKDAFKKIWIPEFSMFFMLFTFAWLHKKNAGYPLGGSTPLSEAMEARYISLGGTIDYNSRVEKILTENDRATGIRLENGDEYRASRVISAADGYSTIFKMLEGKYVDEKIMGIYEKWTPFPPLIFIGLGVNRTFNEEPLTVSGFSFELLNPVEIAGKIRGSMSVHLYNQDPSLAPAGKAVMTVMFETDYDYWKKLYEDKNEYKLQKAAIANTVIKALEQRFPGISSQVEMTDVATPMTFERYTGNWKASFEGWLITPANSHVIMKPMEQTLPGLRNFYMCGQWVEPGGGLPTGIMSARRLVRKLCKEDRLKYKTAVP